MKTAQLSAEEQQQFKSLIAKTVFSVEYINEDEGVYIIIFTDGARACFSAIGDDATHATFLVDKVDR